MKRDDNWHKNKKFTSVDRRKILLPVAVTVVVSFVFLLSGAETYDLSLLQQGLDSMTSGNMGIIFDTVYAIEGEDEIEDEASGTEINDDGSTNEKVVNKNEGDNSNDVAFSGENIDSIKEDEASKAAEDSENSVATEDLWCIGCSDTTDEFGSTIGGDEKATELPLGGVPLPVEEQRCIGCSDTTDEFGSTIGSDEKAAELPLGGVPLPTDGYLGVAEYDSTEFADTINGDDNTVYDQTSQSIIQDQPLVTKEPLEFQMEGEHLVNGGLKVADDSMVSDTSENGALIGQDVLSNPDQTFGVAYSEGEPYIPPKLLSPSCPPGQVPSPLSGECMLDPSERDDYDDNPNPCPPGSYLASSHYGEGGWSVECREIFVPPSGSGGGSGSDGGRIRCPDGVTPLPSSGRVEDCPHTPEGATHR